MIYLRIVPEKGDLVDDAVPISRVAADTPPPDTAPEERRLRKIARLPPAFLHLQGA
jgi:hypothetical protein